jgi:hypothetical protein
MSAVVKGYQMPAAHAHCGEIDSRRLIASGRCCGDSSEDITSVDADVNRWSTHAEVERSKTIVTPFEPNGTLIAVVEMNLMSRLIAGVVPGIERLPLKKFATRAHC